MDRSELVEQFPDLKNVLAALPQAVRGSKARPPLKELAWQIMVGSSRSGAPEHYHYDALNSSTPSDFVKFTPKRLVVAVAAHDGHRPDAVLDGRRVV